MMYCVKQGSYPGDSNNVSGRGDVEQLIDQVTDKCVSEQRVASI